MSDEWIDDFDDTLWLPGEQSAAEQAAFLFRALELRRGLRVLDCPCGSGRIAAQLAHRGCDVVGVDFKPSFVRQARARMRHAGLSAEFHVGDMRRIDFDAQFHAALNWSGSFGYFDEQGNLQVLAALARAVRRGGLVLVDQPNRQNRPKTFKPVQERNGATVYNRWDQNTGRVIANWVIERAGRRIENPMTIRLYTLGEMKKLLAGVGLEVVATYGDFDASEYARSSRRMIIVGRKAQGAWA